MTPETLITRWREDAETFSRYRDEQLAAVCRRHADELEAALRDAGNVPLTLAEAADESGYSPDRLRHLVAEGKVPNIGKRGAPRIRRADLPRKARPITAANGVDADAVARRILAKQSTKP